MKSNAQEKKFTVNYLNSDGKKNQIRSLDAASATAISTDFRKRGFLSVEVVRVTQPKTRTETLRHTMIDNHLTVRTFITRLAYKRAGMPLDRLDPNLKLITAAKFEAKTRLGRSLTPTELSDIKGWAIE